MPSTKVYGVETSTLLYDPNCPEELSKGGNEVNILGPALQELGDLQHSPDHQKRFLARAAVRSIEKYREQGSLANGGVKTKAGGVVRCEVGSVSPGKLPCGFKPNQPDNQMLLVCMYLAEREAKRKGGRRPVILVSKDVNLRHRADHCNVVAEDYKAGKVEDVNATIYGSVAHVYLDHCKIDPLHVLYHEKRLSLSALGGALPLSVANDLYPNQCVFLHTAGDKVGLALYKKDIHAGTGIDRSYFQFVRPAHKYPAHDFAPRSDHQAFAMGIL